MSSYTRKDAIKKAKELSAPIEGESKKRRKLLIDNAATVISVFIIWLTITLYAYNTGFCKVFNIPTDCMPLDLKSYIPLVIQVAGILVMIIFYIAYLKTDHAVGRNVINPLRILYGCYIFQYLLITNHIDKYIGPAWTLLLPILFPLIIEFTIFFVKKCRQSIKNDKEISEPEYKAKIEDYLFDRFLYLDYVYPGLFILVISVLIAPFLGRISAQANCDYQICLFQDEQYAIIANYSDTVLAQRAKVEEEKLIINIDGFTYLPKEGTKFQFKQFSSVEIVDGFQDEIGLQDETE